MSESNKPAEKMAAYFSGFEGEAMIGFRDFAWGIYQICLTRGQSHQEAYLKMLFMVNDILVESLEITNKKIKGESMNDQILCEICWEPIEKGHYDTCGEPGKMRCGTLYYIGLGEEAVCGKPATHLLDAGKDSEKPLCSDCAAPDKAHPSRVTLIEVAE